VIHVTPRVCRARREAVPFAGDRGIPGKLRTGGCLMRLSRSLAAALALAAAAPLGAARAQFPGIGLGAAIGANLPTQKYDEGAKPGVVANLFAALKFGGPVGVRGSLFWSRSNIDNPIIRPANVDNIPRAPAGATTGDVNLLGASADLTFDLGSSTVRPYLVGGVGVYSRRVAQDISGAATEFRNLKRTDTDVGYNGGLGLRLGPLFVEGRYYSVKTRPDKTSFVPVTVGLSF
jgi:hypothetical protein